MARGFTLLELVFVVAAAAILLSVGLPSFQTTVRNMRLTSSVNDIVASMQLARSEAIKRSVPVVVCASGGGDSCAETEWHNGWIVWHDDNADGTRGDDELVLQRRDRMRRDITVATPADQPMQYRLTYAATGFPDVGGLDAPGIMTFCDNQHSDYFGRIVIVPQTGRPVSRPMEDNNYGESCE